MSLEQNKTKKEKPKCFFPPFSSPSEIFIFVVRSRPLILKPPVFPLFPYIIYIFFRRDHTRRNKTFLRRRNEAYSYSNLAERSPCALVYFFPRFFLSENAPKVKSNRKTCVLLLLMSRSNRFHCELFLAPFGNDARYFHI